SVFTEGHDKVSAVLRHRRAAEREWRELPMQPLGNDRFRAAFRVGAPGRHEYGIAAWVDRFATWRDGLARKARAGLAVASELLEGAALVRGAAERAGDGPDAAALAAPAREAGRAR